MSTVTSIEFPGDHDSAPCAAGLLAARVVFVVGATPHDVETVAQSFADQGEPMRIICFERACQAMAAHPENTLAGVLVCQDLVEAPNDELNALRRALPDTPVLPWRHRSAA